MQRPGNTWCRNGVFCCCLGSGISLPLTKIPFEWSIRLLIKKEMHKFIPNHFREKKKKSKHSLENKRRQRLSRNKRKREEKKHIKRGLITLIQELKQENECLHKKFNVEIAIKEKYFTMWRESEKEKDRLKTSKLVCSGFHQKLAKEHGSAKSTEILQIDPGLLQDVEGIAKLGKGRFGTVFLKKFRSSPVAVKYFESCTTSKAVENEALFLKQCCHINLPLIYGMNNTQRPFSIVTQFYGSEDFTPVTLRGVVQKESGDITVSGLESWLHIITQLCDSLCYLHDKTIIHNDIKNDKVVIVRGSSSFFSPVLIDFGKACFISEARKKRLLQEEKDRYYKEHFHIAPEIIEGTYAQSFLSDMYSFGVVIASLYSFTKYRLLKELARKCLKPVASRCTSSELLSIVTKMPQM